MSDFIFMFEHFFACCALKLMCPMAWSQNSGLNKVKSLFHHWGQMVKNFPGVVLRGRKREITSNEMGKMCLACWLCSAAGAGSKGTDLTDVQWNQSCNKHKGEVLSHWKSSLNFQLGDWLFSIQYIALTESTKGCRRPSLLTEGHKLLREHGVCTEGHAACPETWVLLSQRKGLR